ncbi:RNA polymerase sigma-70 factor (ECF subfamily) [Bacillus sp. es.036]|nr:RNA polymerase sigma-70 factor (ECF subfamily) [Bacillus sp. es.036]
MKPFNFYKSLKVARGSEGVLKMKKNDPSLTGEVDEDKLEVQIVELVDEHSKKIYLLAYSYVQDKGSAEDIAQEVFLKCYKNLKRFRGEASIQTWLYRITVNTAKDHLRKKSFQLLKNPTSFLDNFLRSQSSEQLYIEREENREVLDYVYDLPRKYREVIVLHYFHEQTVTEVSQALDLNLNTVKTRLSRARNLLKKIMLDQKEENFNG